MYSANAGPVNSESKPATRRRNMFSSAMASTTANPNGANYGLGSRGPLSGSAVPQQGQSNAQRELTDDQRQEIKEAVSRSYSKYIFMLILGTV